MHYSGSSTTSATNSSRDHDTHGASLFSSPVLRTVLGRVFYLSSFRPPDQYPFFPTTCYHSSMNTASQLEGLTPSAVEGQPSSNRHQVPLNSSQPSAACRACPHTPSWSQASPSRLSTIDYQLFSNRDSKLLEFDLTHRKQRTAPLSNRDKFSPLDLPLRCAITCPEFRNLGASLASSVSPGGGTTAANPVNPGRVASARART